MLFIDWENLTCANRVGVVPQWVVLKHNETSAQLVAANNGKENLRSLLTITRIRNMSIYACCPEILG